MSFATPVWSEFTKIRDGKVLKFRIQELPSENYDDLFELYLAHFITEEPVHKATHLAQKEESLQEYKYLFQDSLEKEKYQIDACCLIDESGKEKIIGGSIMVLERKEDPEIDYEESESKLQTKEVKKFVEACNYLGKLCNVRKLYDLDSYFDDRGICVHPDYRNIGIAGELFKARVKTCKHYGVPMTGAWMSSYGSQISAIKLGWETVYELSYEDFSKAFDLKFEGTPPNCKLMVIRA